MNSTTKFVLGERSTSHELFGVVFAQQLSAGFARTRLGGFEHERSCGD